MFGILDLCSSSDEASEDGNISSFRKAVFCSHLNFRTLDKVHKPIDSKCQTPSSKRFRFCCNTDLNITLTVAILYFHNANVMVYEQVYLALDVRMSV
jgi:hypothetical protein